MANFGARLAYPLPDRIAAARQRERAARARETVVQSRLRRTIARAAGVLLGLEPLFGGRR